MGIPLLHPWANRVAERHFAVAGREVDLGHTPAVHPGTPGSADPRPPRGRCGVECRPPRGHRGGSASRGTFDFAAHEDLIDRFPFPQPAPLEAGLGSGADHRDDGARVRRRPGTRRLRVSPLPAAAGGGARGMAGRDTGRERILLDSRSSPRVSWSGRMGPGPFAGRTFDDDFAAPAEPFALTGGGRRIELSFDAGYPYARSTRRPTTRWSPSSR